MKLKKVNLGLQQAIQEAGIAEANSLQSDCFSALKSGADCVIVSSEGLGKSTLAVWHVIQQLAGQSEESPRALVIVENKEKMLEMQQLFEQYGKYHELRVFGVHDKSNMDEDKNLISAGIDVLIGTPNRLNELLSAAGYNVNRLKVFVVDDAETLLKQRHESRLSRISGSISRSQRVVFANSLTEALETLADKILTEPYWFEEEDY